MPDRPRWFETPVSELGRHPDSDRLGPMVMDNGGTDPGLFSLYTVSQGYGIAWCDARQGRLTDVWSVMNKPKLNGSGIWPWQGGKIPWNWAWLAKRPIGHDGNFIIENPDTGERWGIINPRRSVVGSYLMCDGAWLISEVDVDSKGRPVERRVAGKIVAANMHTFRGNDPDCNGAGVIPRIPTAAQLDTQIPFALSMYAAMWLFNETMVVCPAGHVEKPDRNPTRPDLPAMSTGGVRLAWGNVEELLDRHLGEVDIRYRHRIETLARAMGTYGATVDLTADELGIALGDVDLPRYAMRTMAQDADWYVVEVPHGFRRGVDCGAGPGWYDDISYIGAAP